MLWCRIRSTLDFITIRLQATQRLAPDIAIALDKLGQVPAGRIVAQHVDLDEDLTLDDLANAAQEGFDSVELMKRYSTVGMGPSQGKLSNIAAARHLARVTNQTLESVGLTTARPPDSLRLAEDALQALRDARDAESKERAVQALEKALQSLRAPAK